MSKETGGPAFPVKLEPGESYMPAEQDGMTLRDYFAGQALAEMALDYQTKIEHIAERCYMLADAMIKERNND